MDVKFLFALIILFIVLCVIPLMAIGFIHKNSGMKNTLMKYTPIYVEGYIRRAVQLGVISELDMEYYKKELDPCAIIKCEKWYE